MTVGTQLRQAREQRKLAIADVTQRTKIQPWVLEALESDRLQESMSLIYLKGFLTTYARFLHLDGAMLVEQFPWTTAAAEEATAPATAAAPSQSAIPAAIRMPTFRLPTPRIPTLRIPAFRMPTVRLPRMAGLPARRAAIGVAVCAAVIGIVMAKPQRFMPKISLPQIAHRPPVAQSAPKKAALKPKQVASKPAKPAAAPAAATVQASIAPIPQAERLTAPAELAVKPVAPMELTMTATRATWIVVRADGKLLTQQKLGRGAKERWTAKKQFEIVVAKPSQVELQLNGQPITSFAIAHKGRLAITHQGVNGLPER